MTLRRFFIGMFTHQVEPTPWRFVWLAMPLLLIAMQVVFQVRYLPAEHSADFHYDRFGGFVVPVMLLLNILASDFRWSPRGTVVMRVAAWTWVIFGCVYIFALA